MSCKTRKGIILLLAWLAVFFLSAAITPAADQSIRIASWNIRNFGRAKAQDPEKMRIIARVLKEYDLIAVQEISNVKEQSDLDCPRNQDACPGEPECGSIRRALEQYLNEENGLDYRFVFSPQVWDERYLFIYDPAKIAMESSALVADPQDTGPICDDRQANFGMMMRQPFKGRFKAGNFDFVLLTAHTSPRINVAELQALEYFYRETEKEGEPDVILLGDLNADCSYLKPSSPIALRRSEYTWVIPDGTDTTVSPNTRCAYDRIIFKEPTKEDFTGTWGVHREIPNEVSDHYLIWAEFRTGGDTD